MKITSKKFVDEIRRLIVGARSTVARGVDLVQVHTNFEIGRRIVQEEQKGKDRAAYGKEVVQILATRLSKEFGRGYSASNLAYMRTFYLVYQDRSSIFQTMSGKFDLAKKGGKLQIAQTSSGRLKLNAKNQSATGQSKIEEEELSSTGKPVIFQTLSGKSESVPPFTLSWSHYVFLLAIKNPDERSFYEIESTQEDWTLRELKRQFDSSLYERLALSRDKAGIRRLAREGQKITQPLDLLKEPLVLEFLGLEQRATYSESDLESAIISRIEHFLLELGKGFLFEARQRRFTFDGEHYFVDLVFYNRLLRCYVLIDLKLGRLAHQDLGQMQMYVNYFDRHVRTDDENATVGIVLCKQKNKALVEITLPKGARIHAPEYQLYLPGKEELRQRLDQWAQEAQANHEKQ